MAYRIQYMGIGGILDQAIAIVKNHFALLFSIMLFLLIPFNLIGGLVSLSIMPQMENQAVGAPLQDEQIRQLLIYLPLLFVLGMVNLFVILPVTNAAVIWAVGQLFLGHPVTAGESLRHGFRRLPALIGTAILFYLAVFGGMMLLLIPGILFALWFGLWQQIVVIEGLAGTTALGRSKKLVRNHLGTFLILGLLIIVIVAALSFATAFIPQMHVQTIVSTLVNAVSTMVTSAVWVVFYFSCRCAEENFDLQYLARSIGSEAAATDEHAIPAAP